MKVSLIKNKWYTTFLILCMVYGAAFVVHAEGIIVGEVEKVATIEGVKGFIEGPSFNPADGHIYFVAMDEGWIFRMNTDGKYEKYF